MFQASFLKLEAKQTEIFSFQHEKVFYIYKGDVLIIALKDERRLIQIALHGHMCFMRHNIIHLPQSDESSRGNNIK